MAIKPMILADGSTIYVEVEEHNNPVGLEPRKNHNITDLPQGAEPTSFIDNVIVSGKLLQETIGNTVENVHQSLKNTKPDEWSVELNIGFESTDKGIVSYLGKGNGSLKIKATWKKTTE